MSEKPRVAGVILHTGGRVLLQHRDDREGLPWPGHWAIFGGHVEPDEEPHQTALREMREELGLELQPPLRLFFHGEDDLRERFIFAAELGVAPEALTLREGQGMRLFTREELAHYLLIPVHRAILERWFAGGPSP